MYERILTRHGGVARASELIEAGLSRHYLKKSLLSGQLIRVSHGWIARPGADPELVFAATHRLTISCLTHAARLGLWVRDAGQQHFAVPRPGAEQRIAGAKLHYRRPVVPRHRFALVDSIANTLVNIAHCLAREDAVATWDSALNKGLIDRTLLDSLPLKGPARAVLVETSPFADSGLESYVRQRLQWLRIPIYAQAWLLGRRVDFLLGKRLVLQIDGGTHVGAQRTSDNIHDARLELRGYTVIRVSYPQVMFDWHEVQDMIMQAIAGGKHLESRRKVA